MGKYVFVLIIGEPSMAQPFGLSMGTQTTRSKENNTKTNIWSGETRVDCECVCGKIKCLDNIILGKKYLAFVEFTWQYLWRFMCANMFISSFLPHAMIAFCCTVN